MALLRIILILIITYYLIRLIVRLFFPYLFQRYVNNKMGGSNKQDYSSQKRKKEGEVTIDYLNRKKKRIDKDKGEYIDFKEVK